MKDKQVYPYQHAYFIAFFSSTLLISLLVAIIFGGIAMVYSLSSSDKFFGVEIISNLVITLCVGYKASEYMSQSKQRWYLIGLLLLFSLAVSVEVYLLVAFSTMSQHVRF